MMPRRAMRRLAAVAVFVLAAGVQAKTLQPDPQFEPLVRAFTRRLPREHLSRQPIDAAVAARAFTNFVNTLDGERVYFLAADVAEFGRRAATLPEDLARGDSALAFEVYERFKDRVRNRTALTEQLLAQGFDFNSPDTYAWQRRRAPWVKDEAEWDGLWRRRVQNDYIRRMIGSELARQAATNAPASTNAVSDVEARDLKLTPEEFILKQYRQQLNVLEDADAEWVLQHYLTAVAMAYDPHSAYMSPVTLQDFEIEMKLSLCGIGAMLKPEDGAAAIVRVIPGGPADRDKRLKPGDRIVAVAQGDEPAVDILHWPLQKAVQIIRGQKGTRVVLTVIPASDPTGTLTRKIDLVRDEVKLEEQAASSRVYEVPAGSNGIHRVSVIRLPAFYADMKDAAQNVATYKSAASDVAALLQALATNRADGVILDLRNNGGGSLMEAIRMVGLFVRTGPVVQVRERFGVRVLPDPDPGVVYEGPLVVLVNRLSASASEIVAGALQDYGRAILVGDSKTHGKGTVQSVLPVDERSPFGAIKVTTSTYYRINGGSTQLKGIAPDIVIPSPWDFMETGEDKLDNPMPWTQVPPAAYAAVADLAPALAQLRRLSVERRNREPRFEAYNKQLDRVAQVNAAAALPLNLAARRQLAQTEKELADLQEELLTSDGEPDPGLKTLQRDLVLSEAAAILCDYLALSGVEPARAAAGRRAESGAVGGRIKSRL